MKSNLAYITIALFLSACFEEDKPLPPYNGIVTIIDNNIEYFQSYFNFESDSTLAVFPVDQWALGFSCGTNDYAITTNSGNNWFIANTYDSIFSEQKIPSESNIWGFDRQSAYPDSTAIGNWFELSDNDTLYLKDIYILGHFRGNSYDKKFMVQFLSVSGTDYTIFIKNLGTEVSDTLIIAKNPTKNFVYLLPGTNTISDPEPPKEAYDIIFCPYYKITTQIGITSPYLVRGALIDPLSTQVATDSVYDYESINYNNINDFDFRQQRDIIGFNWKQVYIDQVSGTATYKVKLNYFYIIQTQQGNYYKMHFLNYQLNGENGFPTFEFEKLTPLTGI
jgi:hypothetical protein